jgi:hypothetical protein
MAGHGLSFLLRNALSTTQVYGYTTLYSIGEVEYFSLFCFTVTIQDFDNTGIPDFHPFNR